MILVYIRGAQICQKFRNEFQKLQAPLENMKRYSPKRPIYTVWSKSFRTDFFFKSKTHEKDTYIFLIQNKLLWHLYRLLRGRTSSEKLPKIPLFGPSLIHRLRLLGSQQHPQTGVLLNSFSTWGTENILAEINLETTGCDKGL